MSNTPAGATSEAVDARGKFSINEDWLATVVGLILLTLCLTGVITPEMVKWK